MLPTGEGRTVTLYEAMGDPGTPLPLRPTRAQANDAASWKCNTYPAAKAGDGVIDMRGDDSSVFGGADKLLEREQFGALGMDA